MKSLLKLTFILIALTVPVLLLAQETSYSPTPDDGTDLFLLIIGSLFVAAMLGAAVIGAFLAAFLVLLFIGLFSFGIFTASFTIGLYRRSVSTGFKSLLLLLFGTTCPFFGWVLFSVFNKLFPLYLSSQQASLIGLTSGFFSGILLALMTTRILRELFHRLAKKFDTKKLQQAFSE